MNQLPSQATFGSSRIIRFLSELNVANVEISHQHFVERLGQLIDFSGSITLASTHHGLSATSFDSKPYSLEEVKALFLRVRSVMVQSIVKSTTPNADDEARRLPNPNIGDSLETLTGFDAYRRFYGVMQRDMDTKIRNLRLQIRQEMSGVSPKLAQLCHLDSVLSDTLFANTRQFFAVITRLLNKRFDYLLQAHRDAVEKQQASDNPAEWIASGGWLEQFYKEIQGLLLAELEVRLQPVLGLMEALMKEVETIND